jgi:hypothetical protein
MGHKSLGSLHKGNELFQFASSHNQINVGAGSPEGTAPKAHIGSCAANQTRTHHLRSNPKLNFELKRSVESIQIQKENPWLVAKTKEKPFPISEGRKE